MEPSLRSSTQRGLECKLRRTDPALHETVQRFVESLSNDSRISQYADLAYASNKLATDKWYWLIPIERARVGYLVFMPKQPVVWIDEQFKKSFRISMRVSRNVYEKKSVMIATLDQADSVLRLEDMWLHEGQLLRGKPFTQRWEKLLDFYGLQYKPDLVLQGNLQIKPAIYEPLSAASRLWKDSPTMLFAQGETAHRRLRVQANQGQSQKVQKAVIDQPQFLDSEDEDKVSEAVPSETPVSGVVNAKAVAHEEYPDTYTLLIGGKKKGFAAVQDLDLSRLMRSKAMVSKEIAVKVQWNEEFAMYEILSLANSE